DAINHDQVFAFASSCRHCRETTEADVDFALRNHQMEIGRAQRLDFVGLQADLIQQAVPFHDEIDELLRAWNETQFESPCGRWWPCTGKKKEHKRHKKG